METYAPELLKDEMENRTVEQWGGVRPQKPQIWLSRAELLTQEPAPPPAPCGGRQELGNPGYLPGCAQFVLGWRDPGAEAEARNCPGMDKRSLNVAYRERTVTGIFRVTDLFFYRATSSGSLYIVHNIIKIASFLGN